MGEIISFGKWIFVSTLMMFLATQADRLLLGKLFPLAMLGIYNIAVMFAEIPKQILGKLSNKVIFPLMANFSDLPRPEFRKKILSKRKLLLFPLVLMVAICACFGDVIISLLYDNRYHQAGWMLQLLALGMWPFILNATIDRCFYAIGKPIIPAAGNFAKFLYMIIAVPSMYRAFGPLGGVLAVTFNDLPVYIVNGIGLKKENLTCFAQDLTFTLLLFVIMFLFFLIRAYFDLGSPWASAFSTS